MGTSQLASSEDNIESIQLGHEKVTIERFIEHHPDVTSLDLILFDMNGVVRGKRVPLAQLNKVLEQGICLPCDQKVQRTNKQSRPL